MRKKGQIEMSFGMIFSIILIIVFLGAAFYAIKTFLGFQDTAKAGRLYDQLQDDVDRVWRSSQSSETQEYVVPGYAESICFVDFGSDSKGSDSEIYSDLELGNYGSENIVIYPIKFNNLESKEIAHLDIEKTTEEDNPLCFQVSDGKITLTLKKDFGEALVTISK